ncbi:MAG: SDR family NAD(P)-dependent oxidoreductase [Tidjanibacter sp.]|nr:SDR family NAD(P)-dependent oxidoreductase [Tidjanibacter sp.]
MTNDRNSSIRWALVTGATRGIGLALARGLAHRGYGLILVARSEEGLQQAAHQLRKEGAVAVEYTPIDLAASGAAERLHRLYGEWLVDVVVNNAGTFVYRDLVECNGGRVAHIVGLHIVATTELCRLFGASMARRGKGFILNMSSYAAWVSMGGLGLYGATKSYVERMSYSLRDELRESGVSVTVALPAGVATDLYGLPDVWQRRGVRLGVLMTPERVAERCLEGMFRGRRRVVPGLMNRVMRPIASHLPTWVRRVLRNKTVGFQK